MSQTITEAVFAIEASNRWLFVAVLFFWLRLDWLGERCTDAAVRVRYARVR